MDFIIFCRTQWNMDEKMKSPLHLKDVDNVDVDLSDPNMQLISFIDRRPYLAHPRVRLGKIERALSNANEFFSTVNSSLTELAATKKSNIRFVVFDFTKLTADEQLAVIAKTKVLVGVHGAALSYILLMDPAATLLEIMPQDYGSRVHFKCFANWSGHKYVQIGVAGAGGGGYSVHSQSFVREVQGLLD